MARVSREKSISVHVRKLAGVVWIGNAKTVQVIPAHPIHEVEFKPLDRDSRDLREG